MDDITKIKSNSCQKVNSMIWQVVRQLNRVKKQDLEQLRLTCSQFEILSAVYQISKTKEEIIQINLSEKTQIDPMTTSTILRNLQRRGLITRERSLINTRTVIVKITPTGEELYKIASSKIGRITELIYQNTDEKLLMSRLLILSDKLDKLNF